MNDRAYPPLRPQPPVRVRPRRSPWPMIAGVVVLAVLTVALAAALLGRGPGEVAGGSPSPTVAPTPAGPSGTPAPATGAPSATAAPPSGAITPGSTVATTVDRLSLRTGPGTEAERLGSLSLGTLGYVVAGPTEAGGFEWYQVAGLGLPPVSGCIPADDEDLINCPVWFGWVADGGGDGEPWLTPRALDCPTSPLTAEGLILARTAIERLACFGAEPITFRAWWPVLPEDAGLGGACPAQGEPSGWLLCSHASLDYVTINQNEGLGGVGAVVLIDPASGVAMPARGSWIELRVHLDDPAAQGCDEAAMVPGWEDPAPPERLVLDCRSQMVVESVAAVDGP